ncbi:hypothetical protein KBC04_00220 [Candidatus Babeliales bacterium]|nr:hypothetical protein [Candidatus Babeliales bacterium]MBP9843484.1 hypothetical protein [Candidatus Babeliales bacterium]
MNLISSWSCRARLKLCMVIIFVSLFSSLQPSCEEKDIDYRLEEEPTGLKVLCATVSDLSLAESSPFFTSKNYALMDLRIKTLEQRVTDLRLSILSQTSIALHFQSLKGSSFRMPICRKSEVEIAAIENEIKEVKFEGCTTPLFGCEHASNARRMRVIQETFDSLKESRESQVAESVYKILSSSSSSSFKRKNRKK